MTAPPPVLLWFRVYCSLMALLYLLCLAMSVAFVAFRKELAEADREGAVFLAVYGIFLFGLCLVLFALYGAAPFLPPRPWVWIYHLVLIAIGLSSVCCLPVTVPLLIFWIKPETRAYFGRTPA